MSGAPPAFVTIDQAGGFNLRVKVVPGARRSEVAGVLGDALKVRVAAPPEDGRANRAVVELLARELGVDEGDFQLVQGATSPRKVFRLARAPTRWCG